MGFEAKSESSETICNGAEGWEQKKWSEKQVFFFSETVYDWVSLVGLNFRQVCV